MHRDLDETIMVPPGISQFVARLTLRVRLVRTLGSVVRFALAAAILLCAGLVCERFRPLPPGAWSVLASAAGTLVVAGLAVGLLRPVAGSVAATPVSL